MNKPTLAAMIIGTIITLGTMGVWYLAELNHIGTGALLAFVVPIVGALFIGNQLSSTSSAAQQAANQTNGSMKSTVKTAVAEALAERDHTRTWQTVSDGGQPPLPVDPPTP